MNQVRRVEVTWEDAIGAPGWAIPQQIEEFVSDPHPLCRSIGYLIRRTREHLVLGQSLNQGNVQALLSIPRRNVKELVYL